MVSIPLAKIVNGSSLIWATLADTRAAEPLIERLDPPRRAAVVMALLAIVIVGLFLVTCALLGGHFSINFKNRAGRIGE